jgi:hypothetical protein
MKKLFIIIFLIFLFQTNLVFALEINYPPVPGADPPQVFENGPPELLLANYAKYLFYLCMWTGGILAMLALVAGGVRYILAAGNPGKLSDAKEQITSAFLGLLILLSAVTILNVINPDFTSLSVKPLNSEKLPDKGDLELLTVVNIQSSIDPEVSPGRIVESLFETYMSTYPKLKEEDTWTPRVIRLKNRALAANEIVGKVYTINEELYAAVSRCECENTKVEDGKKCKTSESAFTCNIPMLYECTCDPCKDSRDDILKKEEENHNIVYIGKDITITNQTNKNWEIETIENSSLLDEILRQEEELRLFKQEFYRLERARKYIQDCPLQSLYSYVQVLDNKKVFDSTDGGILRITDFWNDINIIYNRPKELEARYFPIPYDEKEIEYVYDYATFYCDISGSLEQSLSPGMPTEESPDFTGEESEIETEEALAETTACSKEAPFGDYLDRVERTSKLIISKFERIIYLEKDLIERIDKMQKAISQCSSRNCIHQCYGGSVGNIPIPCVDWGCNGDPCPDEVKDQFEKIIAIKNEIDLLVNGEQEEGYWWRDHRHTTPYWIVTKEVDYTDPEQIGIIQILDMKVPVLLQELEDIIRYPMKECFFENLEKKGTALFNCSQSQGAVNPKGEVIYYCCQTEDEDGKLSDAGKCYEKCYLQEDWRIHRDCVYSCLSEYENDELPYCMHELNFYCCNAGEE